MPINYVVQAQLVDLRTDTPKPADRFYVDTNVWFWTVYARLGLSPNPPKPYQSHDYPAYLKAVLTAGADVRWSGLSLSELAYRIEKTEFDIYAQTAPGPPPKQKEFRHNLPAERQRVMQEVETAWQAVEAMGKHLDRPVTIDATTTANALQELKAHALDGYDVFSLHTALASGVTSILTDDGDFCVVPQITLFTANRNVLSAAQAQGKRIVR
jgi:predicted nucleic acid-binding protein